MRRNPAFALELLVVISIIALPRAIPMPATGRAWQQGRTIGCRANLKHRVRTYLDENSFRSTEGFPGKGRQVAMRQKGK